MPRGVGPGVMLNMLDPPRHTALRLLVNKGFKPRTIAGLESELRARKRAAPSDDMLSIVIQAELPGDDGVPRRLSDEELLPRWSELEPDGPVEWARSNKHGGIRHLPVRFRAVRQARAAQAARAARRSRAEFS